MHLQKLNFLNNDIIQIAKQNISLDITRKLDCFFYYITKIKLSNYTKLLKMDNDQLRQRVRFIDFD